MKITYDQEVDVLMIVFYDTAPVEADTLEDQMYIIHYDADKRVVAIEILFASQRIDKPMELFFQFVPRSQVRSELQATE